MRCAYVLFADDTSNTIKHPSDTAARTTWTLLLYLTSPTTGCVGGGTIFYPDSRNTRSGAKGKKNQPPADPVIVKLETDMALLHKHGQDCMLHEGSNVIEGEKWVIRSDLCVKR